MFLDPQRWVRLPVVVAQLAVAATVALPLVWLVVRGAEAGAPQAALAVLGGRGAGIVAVSLGLAAAVAALCVGLSLVAAWLTEATDLPGRRWWRVALTLPLAVPSYVSGFVVIATFGPWGWLARVGLPAPAAEGATGATLALLYAWPYAYLPLVAAFARVYGGLWDAARTLGASSIGEARAAVWPQLRPAITGGALLVALYVLSDFGAVSLTRVRTISYVVYVRYQAIVGREEAVLWSIWLVALAALLVLAHRRLGGAHAARTAARAPRRLRPVALGRWKLPALAFVAMLVGYGVVLPMGVVLFWLVDGLRNGVEVGVPWQALVSTLLVSAAGAVAVVLAALPGVFGVRDGLVGRASAALSSVGFALPGIVVALAMVFIATRAVPALYHTIPLLLVAYVIRFVPVASDTVGDHVAATTRGLVDAARCLGRSPARVALAVTLPMAAPALWSAWLAAFLSIAKELPATLVLAPPGFRTLATEIWASAEEGFFTAVAVPSLLLVTLSAAVLARRTQELDAPRSRTAAGG